MDLAIGRLQPFQPEWVTEYPKLKDPAKGMDPGTSLCKLGYPFHKITPTFDEHTNMFNLPAEAYPPPLFPIEGIFTRQIIVSGDPPAPPFPLSCLRRLVRTPGSERWADV